MKHYLLSYPKNKFKILIYYSLTFVLLKIDITRIDFYKVF